MRPSRVRVPRTHGGVRLTSALPAVALVPADDEPDCVTLLELLDREMGRSDPSVVRDGAVARRVGYADAVTFSAAFKRERGVAPSTVRA